MKLIILKALILALYVATLTTVWSTPGLFGGFSLLVVVFVLAYCGIIVLSQLVSTLVALSHWCVASRQEKRIETFTAAPVVFETETEAT